MSDAPEGDLLLEHACYGTRWRQNNTGGRIIYLYLIQTIDIVRVELMGYIANHQNVICFAQCFMHAVHMLCRARVWRGCGGGEVVQVESRSY